LPIRIVLYIFETKISFFFQFSVFAFGVYSSRLNTALLGLTLVFIQIRPACWAKKMKAYFLAIGFGVPAILVLVSSCSELTFSGEIRLSLIFIYFFSNFVFVLRSSCWWSNGRRRPMGTRPTPIFNTAPLKPTSLWSFW